MMEAGYTLARPNGASWWEVGPAGELRRWNEGEPGVFPGGSFEQAIRSALAAGVELRDGEQIVMQRVNSDGSRNGLAVFTYRQPEPVPFTLTRYTPPLGVS